MAAAVGDVALKWEERGVLVVSTVWCRSVAWKWRRHPSDFGVMVWEVIVVWGGEGGGGDV